MPDQAGGDGVFFDVADDFFEFVAVTDPVVVGFFLPERVAGPAEDHVGLAGGVGFDRFGDSGEDDAEGWLDQDVDVVDDEDPGHQGVQVEVGFSVVEGIYDALGDTGVFQMAGAG